MIVFISAYNVRQPSCIQLLLRRTQYVHAHFYKYIILTYMLNEKAVGYMYIIIINNRYCEPWSRYVYRLQTGKGNIQYIYYTRNVYGGNGWLKEGKLVRIEKIIWMRRAAVFSPGAEYSRSFRVKSLFDSKLVLVDILKI